MAAPSVITSLIPLFVVAAMRRAEGRIHRQLVEARALTAETAIPLTLSRAIDARRLQGLMAGGAVHRTGAGLHFLDADGWSAYQRNRRQRQVVALCVVLALVAVAAVAFFVVR